MHTSTLVKRLLRIDRIVVKDVSFDTVNDEDTIIIHVRPMSRDVNRCPICGVAAHAIWPHITQEKWPCKILTKK